MAVRTADAEATGSLPVVVRADWVPGPPQGQWTYADYAALPEDGNRYEIVEGVLYVAPAPLMAHQGAGRWFTYHLTAHVQLAGLGHVFSAPCDVELTPGRVVQPDLVVVLKEHVDIITESRIVGVPDLVIEIASPGTVGYDRREKQDLYERAGVPELWHADPAARTVDVLLLEEGRYRSAGVFAGAATLPSRVLPELPVQVEQFFA
jgi:Uma2 family endonuclease